MKAAVSEHVEMRLLPNPESNWEQPATTFELERAQVTARMGPTDATLSVLAGGLANLNVRVGLNEVLRIHRRDASSAALEAALLRLPWRSFTVPPLLRAGSDFLVLGFVEHGPLADDAGHGAAVGRALAEIHAIRRPKAGFLDATLGVARGFSDPVRALIDHARAQALRNARVIGGELCERALACLEHNARALAALGASPSLLHGDFKPSNLRWAKSGSLLVLDWEFAWAGPALMDIAQLLRWDPSGAFVAAFEQSYADCGGTLPDDYRYWGNVFDLVNLLGLAGDAPDTRRASDVRARIERTLVAER